MDNEQLSAMMDGETMNNALLNHLINDQALQHQWYRYHLIRDALQKKLSPLGYFNIAERVASALQHESVEPIATVKQSALHTYRDFIRQMGALIMPSLGQFGHIGLAACVALLVLFGAEQYNSPQHEQRYNSTPVFNLLPLGGQLSPVSYNFSPHEPQQTLRTQLLEAKISDYEALCLQKSSLQSESQKQTTEPVVSDN